MRGNLSTDLSKKPGFQFRDAFLGGEDQALMLFELRGDIPLRIYQRLLADVISRYQSRIRLGDFDVIAVDFIGVYFEALDLGALAFPGLQRVDPLAGCPVSVYNSIQLCGEAGANQTAPAQLRGGIVDDGPR